MKHKRSLIPMLGFLLWCGIIMLFNRHDMAFYALSFLFSLTLTFLALAHTGPKYVEIKIEADDQNNL